MLLLFRTLTLFTAIKLRTFIRGIHFIIYNYDLPRTRERIYLNGTMNVLVKVRGLIAVYRGSMYLVC